MRSARGGAAIPGVALVAALHLSAGIAWALLASPVLWAAIFAVFGGALGTGMARAAVRAVRHDPALPIEEEVRRVAP